MLSLIATALLLLQFVAAAPNSCSLKNAVPSLPAGQTQLVVPTGQSVIAVAVGVGVQNYTCSAAGTYTNVGAVAELIDISCEVGTSEFSQITNKALHDFTSSSLTVQQLIAQLGSGPPVLGQHYFVTNPITGTGVNPQFDFRAASRKRDPNAYVTCAKAGDLVSPAGSQNVDWLQLSNIRGDLAKTVFRIDTQKGQPPASCTPGSPLISVKYAAQYWFYN